MAEWIDGLNSAPPELKGLIEALSSYMKVTHRLTFDQKDMFNNLTKSQHHNTDEIIAKLDSISKDFTKKQTKQLDKLQENIDESAKRLDLTEAMITQFMEHENNVLKAIKHMNTDSYKAGADALGKQFAEDRRKHQDKNFSESFKDILAEKSPLFKLLSGRTPDAPGSHKQRMEEETKMMRRAYEGKYLTYNKDQLGQLAGVTGGGYAEQTYQNRAAKMDYIYKTQEFQDINAQKKANRVAPARDASGRFVKQDDPTTWDKNREKLSLVEKNAEEGNKLGSTTYNAGDASKLRKDYVWGPQHIVKELSEVIRESKVEGKGVKGGITPAKKDVDIDVDAPDKMFKKLGDFMKGNPAVMAGLAGAMVAGGLVLAIKGELDKNQGIRESLTGLTPEQAATANRIEEGTTGTIFGNKDFGETLAAYGVGAGGIKAKDVVEKFSWEEFQEEGQNVKLTGEAKNTYDKALKDYIESSPLQSLNVDPIYPFRNGKLYQMFEGDSDMSPMSFPMSSEVASIIFNRVMPRLGTTEDQQKRWFKAHNLEFKQVISPKNLEDLVSQTKVRRLKFDQGGIVPGPIGRPVMAQVEGGETIVPSHKKQVRENLDKLINGNVTDSSEEVKKLLEQLNATNLALLEEMKKNTKVTESKELTLPQGQTSVPKSPASRTAIAVSQ